MRPMRSSADAIVAPVLPAETMALALPVAHRLGGAHERGVLLATHACAAIVVHRDDLGRRDQRRVGRRTFEPGRTDEHDGDAQRRPPRGAPARISPGARSPPIASTAIGSMCRVLGDRVSRRRPATRSLYQPHEGHTVCGSFGGAAARARAAGGAPSFHAPARWLRDFDLRLLLLGNSHGRTPGQTALRRLSAGGADAATRLIAPARRLVPLRAGRVRPNEVVGGHRAAARTAPCVEVGAARRAQSRRTRGGTAGRAGVEEHDLTHHRHEVELRRRRSRTRRDR